MNNYQTIQEAADALGKGGPFTPDEVYNSVGSFIDDLINAGNSDKVYYKHDDHLGLKSKLSEKFLDRDIDELDEAEILSEHEDEITATLNQANIIIPLFNKELNEDDLDDIEEDKYYRGCNDDD